MKKAKIALAALIALTVVSGSLAFKVQKAISTVYIGTTVGGAFTETRDGWKTTAANFPNASHTYATDNSSGSLVFTYITAE